MASYSNPGKN